MKKLIFVILAILAIALASYAGWITFSKSDGKATITIDSHEAVDDTRKAVDTGKRLLDEAVDSVKESSDVVPDATSSPKD